MTTLWSYLDAPTKTAAPAPAQQQAFALRPYQQRAIDDILSELEEVQSTLCVMATGCGKTIVFSHLAKKTPGRVMVIAHREELISQAAAKLRDICHDEVAIEKSNQWADESNPSRIVVASVQTLYAKMGDGMRVARFNPQAFDLVIADEAHHYVSPTYRAALDHFRQSERTKILGVTATPNRADESALGKVFASCAFQYEIQDAIPDGWLVPLRFVTHELESMDLSWIKTVAGDLNEGQLAEELEKPANVAGMVPEVLKVAGDRKTLVFGVSVRHAELLALLFNQLKPGCAQMVCGKTPDDERRAIFRDYAKGRFQILTNCGIATEGFDAPDVQVIALGRPTKSLPLFCQIIGRGTRPMPGVVDGLASPDARRSAIAASDKPAVTVLDFRGNAGRHKLCRAVDALGGKYDDEVIERAQREVEKANKEGVPADVAEELERAKAAIEAEKVKERERIAKLKAVKANWRSREVNPFDPMDVLGIKVGSGHKRGWDTGKELTPRMADLLKRNGINPEGMDYSDAHAAVNKIIGRISHGWSSLKQIRLLAKHNIDATGMRFQDASAAIDRIAKNGWKVPAELKPLQQSGSQTHASPAANTTDVPW